MNMKSRRRKSVSAMAAWKSADVNNGFRPVAWYARRNPRCRTPLRTIFAMEIGAMESIRIIASPVL